jgi:hypothetical protein
MTEYINLFELHKDSLTKWLDENIYQQANDTVKFLYGTQYITSENFENFYKQLNREDYNSNEDYEEALNEQIPQDVYEWYLVSSRAYDTFNKIGDMVVKFKDLHFWGRECSGQKILIDYLYDSDAIKIILNL